MKKKMFLIVLVFACFISFSQENNIKIPSIIVKDQNFNDFNTINLTKSSHPIIIDFWATWCKPCIKELIILDENYENWKNETGVEIYIVSVDDTRSMSKVIPFAKSNNWKFNILLDPNSDFKRAMGIIDIPHTFILDTNGIIVYEHTSFSEGDEEEYYDKLLSIVNKNSKNE